MKNLYQIIRNNIERLLCRTFKFIIKHAITAIIIISLTGIICSCIGYSYLVEIMRAVKDFGGEYCKELFSIWTAKTYLCVFGPDAIAIGCGVVVWVLVKKMRK